jgi:hypothetical protein
MELPKILRNYTEFCVKDKVSTEVTFWNSAEDGILCGSRIPDHYSKE